MIVYISLSIYGIYLFSVYEYYKWLLIIMKWLSLFVIELHYKFSIFRRSPLLNTLDPCLNYWKMKIKHQCTKYSISLSKIKTCICAIRLIIYLYTQFNIIFYIILITQSINGLFWYYNITQLKV
jgi:hypothetical protein